METVVLLQRQMELHGTLRRPPTTPTQLKETYATMKEVSNFFHTVRCTAASLNSSPETVFQCLMHIGMGGVVSFDRQRRDGAVPMHQAKVLARSTAIELEPRLQETLPGAKLDAMVAFSKTTRTLLRIKIEDGNDFATAERALQQFLEYLDFINFASGKSPEMMFKLYMVEDEASLLALLGRGVPSGSRGSSENRAADTMPSLPTDAHLDGEVCRLAQVSESTTEAAGERLSALRTIDHWLSTIAEDKFCNHISQLVSSLSGPLCVCAGEKRSAICRQACSVIITISERTPAAFYLDGPLKIAIAKWCTVLVRGVFVTVSAIAHATDTALRAIVVGSSGNAAALKSILEGLEAGAHPELRRRCLGYLALGVVASRGDVCVVLHGLAVVAAKYTDIGDTACRKMARALCISIAHFTNTPVAVGSPKTETLIRQEAIELKAILGDVDVFETAIFGASVEKRLSTASSSACSTTHFSTTASSSMAEAKHDGQMSPTGSNYDTLPVLGVCKAQHESRQMSSSPNTTWGNCSSSSTTTNGRYNNRMQPPHQEDIIEPRPYKQHEENTVKLSASLRRKIQDAASRSLSRN
ncbi:hypothetical protein DQ04_01351080 [Trypanosoma grayi]|uniref:hypothetical protein n=1 Tax=Trypanosoma grayi TaxID=71804 RepID=UPI0004F46AE2|nr:hypothetical protein DQ04_01351080 [Trypanosoma grayi]KEG12885.1 hypothetical protein DQ04_01351080 [Trypanosoma grayi]